MKETYLERCPQCSQELTSSPELSGKLVQCPHCQSKFPTASAHDPHHANGLATRWCGQPFTETTAKELRSGRTYRITAYKYNENRMAVDSPTHKADIHAFAVTLTFQSEAHTELVEGRTVQVYQNPNGKWVLVDM